MYPSEMQTLHNMPQGGLIGTTQTHLPDTDTENSDNEKTSWLRTELRKTRREEPIHQEKSYFLCTVHIFLQYTTEHVKYTTEHNSSNKHIQYVFCVPRKHNFLQYTHSTRLYNEKTHKKHI